MNCAVCPSHCCGKSHVKPPILMPSEHTSFAPEDVFSEAPHILRIRRGDSGFCKFLDKNQRCTIYERRPLECRIYPYVFDWNGTLALRLHDGCPQQHSAPAPPAELPSEPAEFWQAYERESI